MANEDKVQQVQRTKRQSQERGSQTTDKDKDKDKDKNKKQKGQRQRQRHSFVKAMLVVDVKAGIALSFWAFFWCSNSPETPVFTPHWSTTI
jgi:hypothetical protein